ncbi:MAG TPA: stage II sporulation protein M [Cyclobacteriaceae bacterium]|nr:stage II sporulation protein M [Cyclobacteriaceae bacterium]HLT81454.1 stage II sporulation protein M [Cyclobacteriaceae bacterium]
MREAAFIKLNQERWKGIEKDLESGQPVSPDRLAEMFIQLTDDLAFARTQYPSSRTTTYLNNLVSRIHLEIYRNKRERSNRIINFWKYEVPSIMWEVRRPLFYSLVIFVVAGIIGVVSTLYDDTFVRLIMGDAYVNHTLENIKEGKPTGIYAGDDAWDMFLYITLNNIMVSFHVFILSVFTSVATGFLLFRNGIVLGSFFTMFYNESVLLHAAPVVMLHGTIELSAIVIAGAAGIVMGNSILFPGTYSRFESFRRGAFKGLKIVLGLTPFFIIAGFIESFVTRYANMHWGIKLAILAGSAFIMVYYFVIYPRQLSRNATSTSN